MGIDTQSADFLDLARASRELERLSAQLSVMVEEVADARLVREYDSERRKACLSRCVMAAFKAGSDSSARAEHEARASERYAEDMKTLGQNLAHAESILTNYEVLKIKIDSVRTLISASKATLNL
jgi:hypothetical protein